MTLLNLHSASELLQSAFVRAVDDGDTELAETIRAAQRQVTVAIGMLVTKERAP